MSDPTRAAPPTDLTDAQHRAAAVKCFNDAWTLLDGPRSDATDRELLETAFASRYHWRKIGSAQNFAVGDWQLARVLAVVGAPELAQRFAQASLDTATEAELDPFFMAYAHEALARAARMQGDAGECDRQLGLARGLLEDIKNSESRELIEADLREIELLPGAGEAGSRAGEAGSGAG